MSALTGAPSASFDKIAFPFLTRTAKLEARHHIHEYPKMAGGSVDKMGRKLWVFTFDCPFHDNNPAFPGLYPDAFLQIVDRAAKLDTATLVLPELGEIRAMITSLDLKRKSAILSGEDVTITFVEDDLEPLRPRSSPMAQATLAAQVEALKLVLVGDEDPEYLATIEPYREPLGSLLDCINSVLSIRGQLDLYGQRAQAQLAQVTGLVRQVHDLLTPATLDPVRQVLRSIWDTARTIASDVQGKDDGASVRLYVVPRTMAVGAIAQSLYGSTARGGEVLALNPKAIVDPFAVPAGTRIEVRSR